MHTRDVYTPTAKWDLAGALRTATAIASVAAHLHARGVTHGDLYGHNIQRRAPSGDALLGDFGAASIVVSLSATQRAALQRIEVRAFGCLLEELLDRVVTPSAVAAVAAATSSNSTATLASATTASSTNTSTEVKSDSSSDSSDSAVRALRALQQQCMAPVVTERPSFKEIVATLSEWNDVA